MGRGAAWPASARGWDGGASGNVGVRGRCTHEGPFHCFSDDFAPLAGRNTLSNVGHGERHPWSD